MKKMIESAKNIISKLASITGDKYLHLIVSMIIAFTIAVLLAPLSYDPALPFCIAFFATILLGAAKETYDSYQPDNTFSWEDMLFDLIGIVLGIVFALL